MEIDLYSNFVSDDQAQSNVRTWHFFIKWTINTLIMNSSQRSCIWNEFCTDVGAHSICVQVLWEPLCLADFRTTWGFRCPTWCNTMCGAILPSSVRLWALPQLHSSPLFSLGSQISLTPLTYYWPCIVNSVEWWATHKNLRVNFSSGFYNLLDQHDIDLNIEIFFPRGFPHYFMTRN